MSDIYIFNFNKCGVAPLLALNGLIDSNEGKVAGLEMGVTLLEGASD